MMYMGKDKYENEDLIRYGFPEDVWFHVDNLSSAHVYLRMNRGEKVRGSYSYGFRCSSRLELVSGAERKLFIRVHLVRVWCRSTRYQVHFRYPNTPPSLR